MWTHLKKSACHVRPTRHLKWTWSDNKSTNIRRTLTHNPYNISNSVPAVRSFQMDMAFDMWTLLLSKKCWQASAVQVSRSNMLMEICGSWQELKLDSGGCIFFCVIGVLLYRFAGDFWVWNPAWKITQYHISMYLWTDMKQMIHRITLKESQLNVCDTPSTLRLGCSVKLDDGVYEESDWLQVSSCHGPSPVSNPWDDMGSSWSNGAAPYALVILPFHHQNSLDIWYMFCEEDNHIW